MQKCAKAKQMYEICIRRRCVANSDQLNIENSPFYWLPISTILTAMSPSTPTFCPPSTSHLYMISLSGEMWLLLFACSDVRDGGALWRRNIILEENAWSLIRVVNVKCMLIPFNPMWQITGSHKVFYFMLNLEYAIQKHFKIQEANMLLMSLIWIQKW